jgi:hypothetical protein
MSLLAEVVVEEWLNRQGYFTIRGVKLGNDEIDILAIRPLANGTIERRHIEVSVSTNPISYFSPLPRMVKIIMRPRVRSISGARPVVHGTESCRHSRLSG